MHELIGLKHEHHFARYAPDQFSDWTQHERKGLTGLSNNKYNYGGGIREFTPVTFVGTALIGDIDWVQKGAVTTPTSQGRCATCQSFSAAADIEGAWFTAGNTLVKLSEQGVHTCPPMNSRTITTTAALFLSQNLSTVEVATATA